jgi:hypothetical protein
MASCVHHRRGQHQAKSCIQILALGAASSAGVSAAKPARALGRWQSLFVIYLLRNAVTSIS